MPKFLYRIRRTGDGNLATEEKLNKMGSEGWELVAVDSENLYFKMELTKFAAEVLAEAEERA